MKNPRLLLLIICVSVLIVNAAIPVNGLHEYLNSMGPPASWLSSEAKLARETPSAPYLSMPDYDNNQERLETRSAPVETGPAEKIDGIPSAAPSRAGSELSTEIKQPVKAKADTPSAPPTTAPAPQAAPIPAATGQPDDAAREMLGYINTARAQAGLPPLALNSALCRGACLKSKDMAENGYFSHTSPTYGEPFAMMKSQGITYRYAGENIAKNVSVIGAHKAFMNSSGHRANIMNNNFGRIGLGFYWQGDYLYVTQWFTD